MVLIKSAYPAIMALCLVAPMGGCQVQKVPEEVAKRIEYVETEATLGREAVNSTAKSLEMFRDASDAQLKPAYADYVAAVTRLEEKAGGVRIVFNTAEAGAKRYFAQWEKDIGEITNDDLQNKAMDRRAEMLSAYADLQTKIDTARASFRPFMSNLQDISKAVGADPTVAGKSAAMPTIRQALDQKNTVVRDIDAVIDALKKIRAK